MKSSRRNVEQLLVKGLIGAVHIKWRMKKILPCVSGTLFQNYFHKALEPQRQQFSEK